MIYERGLLNNLGKKFKSVCEDSLAKGIISEFISADKPEEGVMHIEIIQ